MEHICVGRKMEDGKDCKAPKASYSSRYCVHHLDVIEVLMEIWLVKLTQKVTQTIQYENQHLLDEFWEYVASHIEWIMGISSDCPWYYPYSGNRRIGLGNRCAARRLKDGRDCQNDRDEETKAKRLCKECYIFERILHAGYHIAQNDISDKVEMDVFEDNKLVRKQIEFGTRAYVEYCLRQVYEEITGMLSPLDCGIHVEGHRKRFRSYLGPMIFHHPYPSENLSTVDNDFILRYAKTEEEAMQMNKHWYDIWMRKNYVNYDAVKLQKNDEINIERDAEIYEGQENICYNDAEENDEEESAEINYDGAYTQQNNSNTMYCDRYDYEDEKRFATTSAPRSTDWDRSYFWEKYLEYKR